MVVVVRDVAAIAIVGLALFVGKRIPDARAAAAFLRGAFDLVGRGGGAEGAREQRAAVESSGGSGGRGRRCARDRPARLRELPPLRSCGRRGRGTARSGQASENARRPLLVEAHTALGPVCGVSVCACTSK